MHFEIRYPTPALQPYITRYVFVRAEGSTDTMVPPDDDPRFVNGKHVQQLLPNYGSLVFMRNAKADFNGTFSDGLTILGPYRKPVALTTLSGWFEGMLTDTGKSLMPVLTALIAWGKEHFNEVIDKNIVMD